MNDLALFGIIAAYLLICAAFGFVRGLAKSRIRCITVAACAILALIVTLILKGSVDATTVHDLLANLGAGDDLAVLLESEVIAETMAGILSALAMPIIFVVIFALLCFVTWIAHLIVTLVLRNRLKAINERARYRILQTVLMNVLQGIVVVFVVMAPINVYTQLGAVVVDEIKDSALMEESPDLAAMVDDYVDPATNSFLMKAYRVTGGGAVCNAITNFEIDSERVRLNEEIGGLASFLCNMSEMGSSDMGGYTKEETELFRSLADSMNGSKFVSAIISEVMYQSTDAWVKGESFMGTSRPRAGEMMEPLFQKLFTILNADARNAEALQADLYTLADVFDVLIEKDVLTKLENDDELANQLGSNGTVKALTAVLNKNTNMKPLVTEINNVGMRAIATSLDLDGAGREENEEMLQDVAGSLNSTKYLPRAERVELITEEVTAAFGKSTVTIDKEVVESYTEMLLDDLGDKENVTSDDIADFFNEHSIG